MDGIAGLRKMKHLLKKNSRNFKAALALLLKREKGFAPFSLQSWMNYGVDLLGRVSGGFCPDCDLFVPVCEDLSVDPAEPVVLVCWDAIPDPCCVTPAGCDA